jgi:serine/threonine protein kinase
MKKLKIPSKEFDLESLREIQNLKHFKHKNLMQISGIIKRDKGYKNNTYLVMDYGFEVLEFAKHKELKISNAVLRQIIKQIV